MIFSFVYAIRHSACNSVYNQLYYIHFKPTLALSLLDQILSLSSPNYQVEKDISRKPIFSVASPKL